MARLRRISGEELCRILEAHGFARVRQRGSHIVLQKAAGADTLTVVVPNHRNLAIGTLVSIIRQSGVEREAFEA